MNKPKILNMVISTLEDDLRSQLKGQQTAAEGATHAEAKAETKWDTCGLEQSYLARGLAKQFETLARQVEELRAFKPLDFTAKPIAAGALIETELTGERDLFFLLECGGGTEIEEAGRTITVITPESPLGAALLGRSKDETYSFRAGMEGIILHVE